MNFNKNVTQKFLQQKYGSKKRTSFYNKKIINNFKTSRVLKKSSTPGKKVWIDNSINNINCKNLYKLLQEALNLKYKLMFGKKFLKLPVGPILKQPNDLKRRNKNFGILKKINFIFTKLNSPLLKSYSRNNYIVGIEFYQLWFYKASLKKVFNKKYSFPWTPSGYASALWKTFRNARYDYEARQLRDLLKLNWTDALYYKTISTLGPHYLKPIKNVYFKAYRRLKKAKQLFKLSRDIFNQALRVRILFGKNFSKKKYAPQRKNWKFSKKLSRLHYLSGKLNLMQHVYLKKLYLKHAARYRFINQKVRLTSYFNTLTSFGNTSTIFKITKSRWLNYFNLTKRRATNFFSLLKKRSWSSKHNINTEMKKDLSANFKFDLSADLKLKILDTYDYKNEDVLLKSSKPVISYKKFKNEFTNFYFKSKLSNKNFVKLDSARYIISRLEKRIKKLKFRIHKKYTYKFNDFLSSILKNFGNTWNLKNLNLFLFKYTNIARQPLTSPSVLYSLPKHLRIFKNPNYYGVVINITQKNYFFTLVRADDGRVKRVLSSGYSRAKTTRLRRSPIMFNKVFNQFTDYLKNKNINKLRFVRIVQPFLVPKNILFEDQKKLNWYPNQFKHAHIRVRRWIYELKRPHSLPLRGSKLRRK